MFKISFDPLGSTGLGPFPIDAHKRLIQPRQCYSPTSCANPCVQPAIQVLSQPSLSEWACFFLSKGGVLFVVLTDISYQRSTCDHVLCTCQDLSKRSGVTINVVTKGMWNFRIRKGNPTSCRNYCKN